MSPFNRRSFLQALAGLTLPAWFPRLTFAAPAEARAAQGGDVLVCIFQRGAADGLNMLVPFGDDLYYQNRPTIAIPQPAAGLSAIDLDGFFGLHPALAPLKELWDDGLLAPVTATGSHDDTHSHFDAMEFMESGAPGNKSVRTGWIGRHLESLDTGNESPFRAISVGGMAPASLRGPVPATALQSIAEFHLEAYDVRVKQFQETLRGLYAGEGFLDVQANQTLDAVNSIAALGDSYTPANGAAYPDSDFGRALREIARMIKAEVGLEVACTDIGDWDTHEGQGGAEGWMANNLDDMARALHAFCTDCADWMPRITIVTMSEFGRRIDENASRGTDHGHGGAMFVIGGGINGGQVFGDWPGLHTEQLYGPGDLAITTDYRTVLAEILRTRMGNKKAAKVFPGLGQSKFPGLCKKG